MEIFLAFFLGLVSSFIGSFLCFVIWVHYDFEDRWENRKYQRHVRSQQPESLLGGGWQKPVKPPTQESLPTGLPPKRAST